MTNHGKTFTVRFADQLESDQLIPSRSKLLDPKLTSVTQQLIEEGKDLFFLGNDVANSISKSQYELILHGITPCGSKTTIVIKGIFPYVDVETNVGAPAAEQISRISNQMTVHNIDYKRVEVVGGKNFMKFHEEQRQYLRVYFNTLKNRLDFIKLCIENDVHTFSNDRSTYYRVVARNYEFNLSGWNVVSNYTRVWDGLYKSQISLSIDVRDIRKFDPDVQLGQITGRGYPDHLFKYEKMILGSFDIEMIPYHPGHFPNADKCPLDSIFMICVTFHWAKRTESILSVCLTLKESDPLDDMVTIVCADEACLLLAFSKLFDMVQPEFITEFNGGGFDWRNIVSKVQYFSVIPMFLRNMSVAQMQPWEVKESMLSRYFQEKSIKISGATADSIVKSLKMQGFVNFDTLVVFKQLEPNADSHKLNECLKRCNLGSKDDMDIQEMFDIYQNGTPAQMKEVAHYCFIDTFKLQSLLLKKNVVQDRREVSTLSMTSIGDAFNYANGSKVCNIIMNVGEKQGYKFDTTYKPTVEDPKAQFQGAHVVAPIKGIVRPMWSYAEFVKENSLQRSAEELEQGYAYIDEHYKSIVERSLHIEGIPELVRPYIEHMLTNRTQRPISGLDFASLYPSIIMAYNISPETLITDREFAERMMEKGYRMLHVTFQFLGRDWDAWFVRHDNDPAKYGLCPAILIDLFDKRARMKKVLKPFGKRKFDMEIEMKDYPSLADYPRLEEYNQVCFDYGYFDAKQKALKIFMNTFYGQMGNFMSFVCAVETAASVTSMGRHNLLLAKAFVEEKLGMKVYYGDSVSGDTPIMIRRSGEVDVIAIEDLHWGDKPAIDTTSGKEIIVDNDEVDVYSDIGWTKLIKCIRHRTNKELYRITTCTGSVVVTEDHSLLGCDKQKIKPSQCKVGTKLLHWAGLGLSETEQVRLTHEWRDLISEGGAFEYTTQVDAQKAFILYDQVAHLPMAIDASSDCTIMVDEAYACADHAICKIEKLGPCSGYVYDLETESHHFAAGVGRLVVHNTDSLYVACGDHHFSTYDHQYFAGKMPKLQYCTELVRKTFELIEVAKTAVNAHLRLDNGTTFVSMAYEEVLFPAVFVSKKKYFGIPHEDEINFYPKKPFLRGLELVKRGVSDVLKDIGNQIVWEILDINTTCDMLTLVDAATKRFFTTDWDVSQFAKTAVYRPDKQNPSVRKLISRYMAEGYPLIPEPNVRFKYMICKKYLWTYDVRGCQTALSTGDCMELYDRVLEEKIPIDLEYYFNKELTGQMARFIAFYDQFDILDRSTIDSSLTEKERYKKIEEAIFKNAKKYLAEVAKQYSNPYQNQGKLAKQLYRLVTAAVHVKNPKTKKIESIYPSNVRRVVQLLEGCSQDRSLDYLRGRVEQYIHKKYLVDTMVSKLDVEEMFQYLTDHGLFQYLQDCSDQWISAAVLYIRTEFDFDKICTEGRKVDSPWDIFTKEQLSSALEASYVGLSDAHATAVLEVMQRIVARIV